MGCSSSNGIYETGSNASLSLKQISLKLATLLALTCPKRVSSLAKLDINHYRLAPEGAIFTLTTPTKTSRPDESVTAFFASFAEDATVCPVECLKAYMSVTKNLRRWSGEGPNVLFISCIKPHGAVTTATVARWIRSCFTQAGVDTSIFKSHSVRGAATSAAAKASVPMQEILDMADWSNASTFQRFYYRPILSANFAWACGAILKCYCSVV